jgi:hypothetical protein
MNLRLSQRFLQSYRRAPAPVQRAFDKQSHLLAQNLRHPSLRAKKYDESLGMWQARVNREWRFYFTIEGDSYHLHEIKPHPK